MVISTLPSAFVSPPLPQAAMLTQVTAARSAAATDLNFIIVSLLFLTSMKPIRDLQKFRKVYQPVTYLTAGN